MRDPEVGASSAAITQSLWQPMHNSGKLLTLGIFAFALAGAGLSWWFRYAATNQAAKYWGPQATRLIRDAPIVEFHRLDSTEHDEFQFSELKQFLDAPSNGHDISSMPGRTHLRNALLEDRSYVWPPREQKSSDRWRWILVFREPNGPTAVLAFSPDWTSVIDCKRPNSPSLSTQPIANGLETMFRELTGETSASH